MPYRIVRSRARRTLGGAVLLAGTMALAACGGGSSSGSGSGTGSLTLGITDAPVDGAIAVNVVFTGVTLKLQDDGDTISFACGDPGFVCDDPADPADDPNSRTINLLDFSGPMATTLLDAVEIPAGTYEWIRLEVDAADPMPGSTGASEIVFPGPEAHVLAIPSGSQTGLKLVDEFEVAPFDPSDPASEPTKLTIDFDLRSGVTKLGRPQEPVYFLHPALRIVETDEAGHIEGEITPGFVSANCPTGDSSGGLGVYVYVGNDATTGDLGDPTDPPETTATPELNTETGNYDYSIGFLDAGPYTVALTCAADSDGSDTDEDLVFVARRNVQVAVGAPTEVDFELDM